MGFWCFQNQAKNQRRTMSRTVRLRSSRGSTTSSTPPTRRSSSGRQFCAHMFPVPNERFVRFRSEFASKIESKPNGVSPRPSTVASVVAIGRWFWGMFYWPIRPRPFFVESDWIWPSMRTLEIDRNRLLLITCCQREHPFSKSKNWDSASNRSSLVELMTGSYWVLVVFTWL